MTIGEFLSVIFFFNRDAVVATNYNAVMITAMETAMAM
jgi:hypothetical protein